MTKVRRRRRVVRRRRKRPVSTWASKSTSGKILTSIGIVAGFLFTGVLIFAIFLVLVIEVLLNGPSEEARVVFTHSCNETSALKFIPRWFIGDEETDKILNPAPKSDTFVALGFETAQTVVVAAAADPEEQGEGVPEVPPIQIDEVQGSTFKGKMMIIADPKRVVVGTLPSYGGAGKYLPDFISDYNAVAGTNAGGFEDPEGHGNGGIPDGIVIDGGKIKYGSAGASYLNVIGFDADGILHIGNKTGQQALDEGIINGVSFTIGHILVKDGVGADIQTSGLNPRTAIGQRADGAILLTVIEGRHAGSLGASCEDLRELFLSYGAVNATMLDGGTSSVMYYQGEQITRGSNLLGQRRLPTTILVLPEGGAG